MIHGKKRNGDLFRRLTESWGYTKSETNEEEVTPLDEEMAAEAALKRAVTAPKCTAAAAVSASW